MGEKQALILRIKRERTARLEAEKLLECKSRELHFAVQKSTRLTEELKSTVQMQTLELLSAQKVTRLGTFFWNLEKNLFSWSAGSCDVLGLDQAESTGSFSQFLSVIHPDDRHLMQELYKVLDRAAGTPTAPAVDTEKILRIVGSHGNTQWIKFICERADGISFTGAIQDVTESMLAAKDVRQTRMELEQRLSDLESAQKDLKIANKEAKEANATKSRFIAMISHDIRTPINGLLGTLTLLTDRELDDSQRELLEVATASAESLRVLVNDVIDFARLETGQIKLELTNFSIRDLASQLVDFWRPLANASDNRLELGIDDSVSAVLRGDPIRLGQILNNLLSNAIKFTKSGTIILEIKSGGSSTADPSKQNLTINVVDTGIGIEKSEQENLFKDFSQVPIEPNVKERFLDLSGAQHGAGLGLAICRALVKQMSGKISVISSPGRGSSFTVKIPLERVSNADSVTKVAEFKELFTSDGNQPVVLIAEDVPANQLVSRMLLQSFGCQVDIANDGAEAVAACKNRNYDFVLMDVSMPRLDGISATEQIRGLEGSGFEELPIIGLTAFAFEHEKQRFLDAGMNEVVCKPIVREKLYDAVKKALSITDARAANAGESEDQGAVDLAVLHALTSGLTDAQIRKVVQQVSDDLDKYRRDAISEAKGGNISGLSRSCHAVKGLAASFGSHELAGLASSIEESAREGDSELAVASTIDRLDPITDDALEALEKFLASPSPLSNAC